MSSKVFFIRALVAAGAVLCLGLWQIKGLNPVYWAGLAFYLVCLAMYAKALYNALFKMKKVTADLLVVTVMVVSLVAGQALSGALVAWFISLGLAIAFFIIEHTGKKINALTQKTEKTARVSRQGEDREVPVDQVVAGELVMVPCGETIPVDGQIVQGSGSIDESVVTGEPFAVFKTCGDTVLAGSVAVSAPLTVKADKQGDQGFVYTLAREMQKALQVKPKIHRRADTIVQIFISGAVIYAFGVFAVTAWVTGDAGAGLMRMAAVTAIACPCAWALSVPTAFAAAIGGLSSRGILVRGGLPLELAARVRQVVLDKTGTLTLSRPQVAQIRALGMDEDALLAVAAGVETGFTHPVARAIVKTAREKGVTPARAGQSEYLPGQGVRSMVNGREVTMGNRELFRSLGIELPEDISLNGKGIWVALDRKTAGVIEIQDSLRPDARDLGDTLRSQGVEGVTLATGDTEAAEAGRVAQGIRADHCRWGLSPQDKQALVKELKKSGPTLMVGDGVNDAICLAEADVGVSMGRGKADLAIQSSDIIVMQDNAQTLPLILETGRRLVRIIHQNYAWAIIFNTVGIVLATAGILPPWLAALLHHGSSVFVVANSARLTKGGKLD